jgi:hypothetical protein
VSASLRTLLIPVLGVALASCGTNAADATDVKLTPGANAPPAVASTSRPAYRDVTIPAGTVLPLTLTTAMASDSSAVEDRVSATLTRAIKIDGQDVVAEGARLDGTVTSVIDSGRVKGRAMIAFRFTSLHDAGDQYDVTAASVTHRADATKSEDAVKIGVGAGAGAIIGGLIDGKSGAAKGAAIGGGAGTGVVLATKGKDVRLGPGADVSSQLTAPLVVRVRVS